MQQTNTNALNECTDRIQAELNSAPSAINGGHLKLAFPSRPISMNGFTHGLTGHNILLTEVEFIHYIQRGCEYMRELQPVGISETDLVQRIIDGTWRLHRIPALEQNLFSTGMQQNSPQGSLGTECADQVVAQADAFRADCERAASIEKLSRHELRLNKVLPQLRMELERLQQNRRRRDGADKFKAAESPAVAWYERMAKLAAHLEELHKKRAAEAVAAAKQRSSGSKSDCKTGYADPAEVAELKKLAADLGLLWEDLMPPKPKKQPKPAPESTPAPETTPAAENQPEPEPVPA